LANPYNSPFLKKYNPRIIDTVLFRKWSAIEPHLTKTVNVNERSGYLEFEDGIYVAKNSNKMRLRSYLDWVYYTPKTLAQALNADTVEVYYEIMLRDVRSDPNVWKDTDLEQELKAFYAARSQRASLI
jgi:hypothetical protein